MQLEYFHQRGFNQGVSDSYTDLRGEDLRVPEFERNMLLKPLVLAVRAFRRLLPFMAELQEAKDQFRSGYREGYAFHQKEYQEDDEVKQWVHQEKYF